MRLAALADADCGAGYALSPQANCVKVPAGLTCAEGSEPYIEDNGDWNCIDFTGTITGRGGKGTNGEYDPYANEDLCGRGYAFVNGSCVQINPPKKESELPDWVWWAAGGILAFGLLGRAMK